MENISKIGRHAIVVCGAVAALVLTGCSSSGSQAPLAPVAANAQSAAGHGSWAVPDAAKQPQLLYVTTVQLNGPFLGATGVNFYSYRIGKLKGSITISSGALSPVIPNTLCVAKHTIWVANIDTQTGALQQYAFGATDPSNSISSPGTGGFASCAYDKSTGNLATVEPLTVASGNPVPSDVWIYPNDGSGTPTQYSLASTGISSGGCAAYDNEGNLFVDGTTASGTAVLAELPKGQSSFVTLKFKNGNVYAPGAVQWDGKGLTITDVGSGASQAHAVIYQLAVSGSTAKITGSTYFGNTGDCYQPFIKRSIVVAACYLGAGSSAIYFYHYPAGGAPMKTITVSGTVQTFNAVIIGHGREKA